MRRGFFTIQQLTTSDCLHGRAVALDLTIPTVNNRAFQHRFIGIYAPWDPGGNFTQDHSFWLEITRLCNADPFSWSLYGDFNATLSASETSNNNATPSISRAHYLQFLHLTDAVDLWQSQPQTFASATLHTCRSPNPATPEQCSYSIIDRVAASRTGILAGEIAVHPTFVPCTDHKPIFSRLVFDSPSSNADRPHLSEISPLTYSPRFRHPFRHDKIRLQHFSETVSQKVADHPDIQDAQITSDEDFQRVYDAVSDILLSSAKLSFILPSPPRLTTKVTNPTIRLLLTEIRHINRLIGALSTQASLTRLNLFLYLPQERWVPDYISAFFLEHPNPIDIRSTFRVYLTGLRRKLHKLRFAEERQERTDRLNKKTRSQFLNVLHGGSSKRLYPHGSPLYPLP
jgi:hypothetical protein